MTQRILFSISGLLIIGAIIAIIITNKPQVSDKLITINTEHNYVYTESKLISFRIYSNKSKHKIHFKENISYVYLEDENKYNRFEMYLLAINYSHEESYLGDPYYAYTYTFEMPKVQSNLYLENANLSITLANGVDYLLPIGDFNFLYYPNVAEETYLDVKSFYGFKAETSEFSRLDKIILVYEKKLDIKIENIYIDGQNKLEFHDKEGQIEIMIPFELKHLSHVPIVIEVIENGLHRYQVIDNFQYFNDFNILENSADLVNVIHVN